MAIYRVGSPKSDEVKQIQQKLGITADGVYGQQTKDAVTAYQKANNLQVDGVVGDETWNSLFGTNTVTQTPQTTQNTVTQYTAPQITPANRQDYAYDPNTNEAYLNALKALEQANKNAPTYGASYDQQLQELYDKIVNREDFAYDLNADALYEQYQQKFTALGDQAMQDTMGQAAALTGGYASSYAQNAGQQAYNQYLTQLNDIVPDLYNQAYGRYQDEGQDLLNQYGMLGDMADDEYGKYMDAYNQWLAQIQMSRDDVDTAYNRGYTDFVNSQQMAYQQDQANIAYAQWQQEMAAQQQRWEQEMAYQRERDRVSDSQWERELAARYKDDGKTPADDNALVTDLSGYDPNDLYYMGNNIYSKSKGTLVGFVNDTVGNNALANRGYSYGELQTLAAAGYSKKEIEGVLADEGVNINDPAVQAEIKWALGK